MEGTAIPLAISACIIGLSATGFIYGKITTKQTDEKRERNIKELLKDPAISKKYKEIEIINLQRDKRLR